MSPLLWLILGLAVFLGGHAITRQRAFRADLIAARGENFYRTAYSLFAIMGVALIAHGFGAYRSAGYIQLWSLPRFVNHIAILFMWPAMILLVATYSSGQIKARVKHPMLTAIKLWALTHLVVNGDLGSVLLFGSFLGWAIYTRIKIKRSGEEVATAPIDPRRAQIGDAIAVIGGTILTFVIAFWLHQRLFGVAVL